MKNKTLIWILAVILVLLLIIGAFVLYNKLTDGHKEDDGDKTEDTTEENASLAPDFIVTDAEGNDVNLSDYFGKPIVLNFWASWCPPCKAEMPHFEEAFNENPDVQFLMVNVTGGNETVESAGEHIKSQGYTFPVFYDTKGMAAYTYQTYSIPVTYFIDSDGKVVTYQVGMMNKAQLDSAIEKIK